MSVAASVPMSRAGWRRPSLNSTSMDSMPSMTWLFVMMCPSRLTMAPEPSCIWVAAAPFCKPRWKNANGSLSSVGATMVFDVVMLTTDGTTARASSTR